MNEKRTRPESGAKKGRLSSRFAMSGPSETDERIAALEAENLHLRDEVDRLRLALSGAHPSMTAADALNSEGHEGQWNHADPWADDADELMALKVQTMSARSELVRLIGLMQRSLETYEKRLSVMPTGSTAPEPVTAADDEAEDMAMTRAATVTTRIPATVGGRRPPAPPPMRSAF